MDGTPITTKVKAGTTYARIIMTFGNTLCLFMAQAKKNEAGILPNSVMEHEPIQSAYTERVAVHKIWFS